MALNIKNRDVEALAREVAKISGDTLTEAIRRALQERRDRLRFQRGAEDRSARLRRYLENEAWPLVPDEERGRRLTRAQEDEILGYGGSGA